MPRKPAPKTKTLLLPNGDTITFIVLPSAISNPAAAGKRGKKAKR